MACGNWLLGIPKIWCVWSWCFQEIALNTRGFTSRIFSSPWTVQIWRKWSTSSLRADLFSSRNRSKSSFSLTWMFTSDYAEYCLLPLTRVRLERYPHWARWYSRIPCTLVRIRCIYPPSKEYASVETACGCPSKHHLNLSGSYNNHDWGRWMKEQVHQKNSYSNNFCCWSNKTCV